MATLASYLEAHGLTQTAFAEQVNLDRVTVWRLVHGKHRPSLDVILRIREATKGEVSIEEWVGGHPAQGGRGSSGSQDQPNPGEPRKAGVA